MDDEIITMFGTYKVQSSVGDIKYGYWEDDVKRGHKIRVVSEIKVCRTAVSTSCRSSYWFETEKYSPYKYC